MNDEFKPLNPEEILSLTYEPFGRQLNFSSNNFVTIPIKIQQFSKVLTKRLTLADNRGQDLCSHGINCEVLRFGANGWQKGRLRARVILEFCPDQVTIQDGTVSNI